MSKFKHTHLDLDGIRDYIEESTLSERNISINGTRPKESKNEPKLDLKCSDEKSTCIYSGEKIAKHDKVFSALGSLEELVAYIGVLKSENFSEDENNLDMSSSEKLFLFARLTQIQECLIDIMTSIAVSKKLNTRYENTRFNNIDLLKDLEYDIAQKGIKIDTFKSKDKPLQLIPGTTLLQAKLLYCRAITRRVERQVCGCKNTSLGLNIDKLALDYLNKLGDYFLALSLYILQVGVREPLKKALKNKK